MIRSVVICVLSLTTIDAAKILCVFMTPSYSHQVIYQPIWKELSKRGHHVTVLTPNPLNDSSLTNLTEIDLSFSYGIWKSHNITTLGSNGHSTFDEVQEILRAYLAVGKAQLAHPEVRCLIQDKNQHYFDLVIVEFLFPIMYGFKDVFNCPLIGVNSLGLTGLAQDFIGMPRHPVLNPEMILPFSTNLSFKERIISVVYSFLYKFASKYTLFPKLNIMARQYFGEIRNLEIIMKDVSLVIVNSNLAIYNVQPTVPAYVEISGIHIQVQKQLPNDLKNFLDRAKEGVIYFSLGTNIRSNSLPKDKLKDFMQIFSQLPYKVLWKFENDDLPNKPSNVEISKWLPQQDVLAHPNVKLFITQGGLQSLDEAIHYRVPVLMMPFFGDQRYNAHHLSHKGAGLAVDFHALTKREFKQKILEVIRNPKYKKAITRLALVAADQPVPALEKAIWWIEYVLRHDGAPHLRHAAVDMPFYQYYMLDVTVFLLTAISFLLYTLLRIFKHVVLSYRFVMKFIVSMNIYSRKKDHDD